MGTVYHWYIHRFKTIYSVAIFFFVSTCLGAPSEDFDEMGMGSDMADYIDYGLGSEMDYYYDGIGSEMDDYYVDELSAGDYADELWAADYADLLFYEGLDEYGEEYDYEYENEEYEDMDRIVPEERSDVNNCKDKANGDKCTKTCRGPSCKNAKCWEQTCLTGRKYKIVAGAGKMPSKTPGGDYNNCAGKKDGEACKKRCHSKACQEGKCFKTVCLTSRKYRIAGGSK